MRVVTKSPWVKQQLPWERLSAMLGELSILLEFGKDCQIWLDRTDPADSYFADNEYLTKSTNLPIYYNELFCHFYSTPTINLVYGKVLINEDILIEDIFLNFETSHLPSGLNDKDDSLFDIFWLPWYVGDLISPNNLLIKINFFKQLIATIVVYWF